MRFVTHHFKISLKSINFQQFRKYSSTKRTHPSADRNSQPIADALLAQVDLKTPGLQLLEISSGSGQHAGFLAPFCSNIAFQPTEFDRDLLPSIEAYAKDCATGNIRQPLFVDVSKEPGEWVEASALKPGSFDYMFNCNMLHISPWACAIGLFCAANRMLKPNGKLFTYGAYKVDGVLTPESNVNFDASLKMRNPEWGIRDIIDLKKLAANNNIELINIQEMPANNKFLTWSKRA